MSETRTDNSGGLRIEHLLIVGALVLALGAFFYLSGQSQQVLRKSPTGFDGLHSWLGKNEYEAQNFVGGWLIDPETVDLLVIPVYDTNIEAPLTAPENKEELLTQQDEYDLYSYAINSKIEMRPTLVILPKWRSGVRLTGQAHPDFLIERRDSERVLHQIAGRDVGLLTRLHGPFTTFPYTDESGATLEAGFYATQVFEGKNCKPLIGRAGQMVLADCPVAPETPKERVLILSDPDLLNNHGLRLYDNADIALDLAARHSESGSILIDYSESNWFFVEQGVRAPKRSWSDLLRFFEYPFSVLWIGSALLLALFLWRAALRFGPVISAQLGLSASKMKAIRARGRVMRLTNQDGALLSEYIDVRISAVVTALFGPAHHRRGSDEDNLRDHLKRHDKNLSDRFSETLMNIRSLPARVPVSEAIHHVDNFEQIVEQITDDT